MKAVRVHAFGGIEALTYEDVPQPATGEGQVLVRVAAAGVGPWDAWVREGRSALPQPLPLVLGSDVSGVVEAVGPGVTAFASGEAVFGVTNARFTGGYAEYAAAEAAMVAGKPRGLADTAAASLPIVACTAWQMVFDHARVEAGQRVLVQGGAGNVGAYAVQLCRLAGAHVVATSRPSGFDYLREIGAAELIGPQIGAFAGRERNFHAVIDTVGGDQLRQSFALLRPGGILISAVTPPDQEEAARYGVRAAFLLVSVTTETLGRIAQLIEAGKLRTRVGETLPLSQARRAHEMLAGRPHKPGKIVLLPGA